MDLSYDEVLALNEAIDDRQTLLRKLPASEWRDSRLAALTSIAAKCMQPGPEQTEPDTKAEVAQEVFMTCPSCHARTLPEDNFCVLCGNELTATTIASLLGQTAKQVAIERPVQAILRAGQQEYVIDKLQVTIGRAPMSDIILSKDKLTSRRHATIRYEDDQYLLYDDHSSNGVFVNEQQIEDASPYVLQDGDIIGIGDHELIFHCAAVRCAPTTETLIMTGKKV